MGSIIYYGRCRGGPYNAKRIAHGESPYWVGFDPDTMKSHPGQQLATADRPCMFGCYVFDARSGEWLWDDESIGASPDEVVKPVNNPNDEKAS
jgi:hypothetical protein